MTVAVPYKAIDRISEAEDPKQAILDAVAEYLPKIQVHGDLVLVGTYIRPRKTKGGIIRPDINVQEDIWQGKVGLVLKLGTTAYTDTQDYKFPEQDRALPGSWCVFWVGDGKQCSVGDFPCRLVRDINIHMTIEDPNIIF